MTDSPAGNTPQSAATPQPGALLGQLRGQEEQQEPPVQRHQELQVVHAVSQEPLRVAADPQVQGVAVL